MFAKWRLTVGLVPSPGPLTVTSGALGVTTGKGCPRPRGPGTVPPWVLFSGLYVGALIFTVEKKKVKIYDS